MADVAEVEFRELNQPFIVLYSLTAIQVLGSAIVNTLLPSSN